MSRLVLDAGDSKKGLALRCGFLLRSDLEDLAGVCAGGMMADEGGGEEKRDADC